MKKQTLSWPPSMRGGSKSSILPTVTFGFWGMTSVSFVTAIQAHLETGYRIFHKSVHNPPSDTLLFSANIGLDPDSDDDDEDVYVEIRLKGQAVVIICDAHNHCTWQPRLPK